MRLSGLSVSYDTILLAGILDGINFLAWSKTKDAEKGRNRPKQILSMLLGNKEKLQTYATGEEFEKARKKLTGGVDGN